MLVDRKEYLSENENETFLEGYFDSSNIVKTIYFPTRQFLYIIFKNALVYSYSCVTKELYDKFEKAESQGKFFVANMRKNSEYQHHREFKMYEFEMSDIFKLIEEKKSQIEKEKETNDQNSRINL
jgi:hypothetical protein